MQWYEDRLIGEEAAAEAGRPSIEEMDLAIASLDSRIWSSGKKANEAIAEIHKRYWKSSLKNDYPRTEDGTVVDPPDQLPAPYVFEVADQVKARPLASAPDPTIPIDEFFAELLRSISKCEARLVGNHADDDVLEAIADLKEALEAQPVSEGSLIMRFQALNAAVLAYGTVANGRERSIVSALMALSGQTEQLLNLYPSYRKIEASRLAMHFQSADMAVYVAQVQEVAKLASESALVAKSATDALTQGLHQVEKLTARIDTLEAGSSLMAETIEQRAVIASTNSVNVRNFSTVVAAAAEEEKKARGVAGGKATGAATARHRKASQRASTNNADVSTLGPYSGKTAKQGPFQKFAGSVGSAIAKGGLKGIEKGAEKVASGALTGGFAVLAAALLGPLVGVGFFVQGLVPVTHRLKEAAEVDASDERDENEGGLNK